jgi:hypothetical protein
MHVKLKCQGYEALTGYRYHLGLYSVMFFITVINLVDRHPQYRFMTADDRATQFTLLEKF